MLGWIATFLTLFGLHLNGKKIIHCWPIWLGSNAFWVAHWYVVYTSGGTLETSSFFINFVLVYMNVQGWRQWRRDTVPAAEEEEEESVTISGGVAPGSCRRVAAAGPGQHVEWHSSGCRRGISECTLHIMKA